ncbi:DNA cytosine methyltransferase [Halobacterium noricense]|uniref:DNA cytosine methyltransferase n=1 Tax=Halobacterium noricense TaxID=223182 RepID=UPI001E28B186|nr:DNA cytosine methyltransferase [Halobacterium noricense]UHH25106.1 DNA cytosine methyltransferase [Halobacterium noricense]
MKADATAVDLFCGVGGLTHGLETAGIPVAVGVDRDDECEHAYEANNEARFEQADVADLDAEQVSEWLDDGTVSVLAGCAPCQPFSNLNNAEDSSERDDWGLVRDFGNLVEEVEPGIVVMENVSELRNKPVYSDFVNTLWRAGYDVSFSVVECPDYGIPQDRKRIVVLASKYGPIELKGPTHSPSNYPTVRDAIGNGVVPEIDAGGVDENDPLHRSRTLEEQNIERIRQSKPGGTWRDWDPEIRLDCHTKESGQSFGSVYGRMQWDTTAPTITTQYYNYGSGRFGHPEQDRAISLREGAILQTFPPDYEFVEDEEDIHYQTVGRFVGNAVPVRLAEVVGETIVEHVENYNVAA